MRSISEFIQEQESGIYVSAASDNLEKAYAECAAALSLAKCYSEQAVIMEFAEENGIDSLNIVQESGDEKKENIFKRAGAGIKNAWGKVVEFFKAVYRKISAYVAEKKMNSLKKLVDKLPDEAVVKGLSKNKDGLLIIAFMLAFDEMLDELAKNDKNENDAKSLTEILETFKLQVNEVDESDEATGSDMKYIFNEALFDRKKVYATLKDIDKKIKELEKTAKEKEKAAEGKDDAQANSDKAMASTNRANADFWRSFINAITVALDNALKQFHKYYAAIKKAIKKWNESHPDQAVDTSDIEDINIAVEQ